MAIRGDSESTHEWSASHKSQLLEPLKVEEGGGGGSSGDFDDNALTWRCSAKPVIFCGMPVLSSHGLPKPVLTWTGSRPDCRLVRVGVQYYCIRPCVQVCGEAGTNGMCMPKSTYCVCICVKHREDDANSQCEVRVGDMSPS